MRGRSPRRTGTTGFTESLEQYQRRVTRDRVLGVVGLGVAFVLFAVNLVMEFAPSVVLLPGGHSELYFLTAIVIGGAASWVAFDLGMNRRERR